MNTYKLNTLGMEHTLPVRVEGEKENRYVKFQKISAEDAFGYFDTNDKKLQNAIEKSSFFENGEIELLMSDESGESGETEDGSRKMAAW